MTVSQPPSGSRPPRPHDGPTLGVVIVAAGRGERLRAAVPKAFFEFAGRTLLEHAIATVTSLPTPGHLVIVAPESHLDRATEIVTCGARTTTPWGSSVVPGGSERHESVRLGLAALPASVDTVLVHDAARPLASTDLFERVIAEVRRTGAGVIPALPVVDTIKRVADDGTVLETVDRAPLAAVQTPQGFPREQLESAHLSAQQLSDPPTDDAEVLQRWGGTVRTVPGERIAHKLTHPDDIALLEHYLDRITHGGAA